MAAAPNKLAVFSENIAKEAADPARALLHERGNGRRRLRVDTCVRRVFYTVAGPLDPKRHFHILGLMSTAESAEFFDRGAAIEGEGPRCYVETVHRGEGVTERDAEGVFRVLHVLKDIPG